MNKTRNAVLTLVFCFLASMCFGADWNQGTWKLNEAKSKIPAGAAKNSNVVYSMVGDKVKCVVDGWDGAGKATHNEWTGSYDGKDYALVGDPNADTRAIKWVTDAKYRLTNKKGGKTTTSGTITFSKDGKTRTVSTTTKGADGKKTKSVFVYDRQS